MVCALKLPVLGLMHLNNVTWSVYSSYLHYFSWWSYFSYHNEDFYTYFKHHLWLTITEKITTCLVLNLWGMDHFIADVMYGQGRNFHKARTFGEFNDRPKFSKFHRLSILTMVKFCRQTLILYLKELLFNGLNLNI
ncbi:hypothetical protein DPMN_132445 [Dreissena polymorpha]|uniref:Uncharacterized protein n=1 Tax=Dreissena polymorpha TaxID=45954 RepID=A0A9D4FVY1_DREPO|nr:hypothetical protein DPMN_132445 [Dreissena polymorpha]